MQTSLLNFSRRSGQIVISSIALATLQTNKFNKQPALPLTQDLVLLKTYLVDNLTQLNKEIVVKPFYSVWRALAENALVRIILFNKRCSSETALLLVETFQNRIDWKKCPSRDYQ